MKEIIEKMRNFLSDDRYVKIILGKEEVKTIIEYYKKKGEKDE